LFRFGLPGTALHELTHRCGGSGRRGGGNAANNQLLPNGRIVFARSPVTFFDGAAQCRQLGHEIIKASHLDGFRIAPSSSHCFAQDKESNHACQRKPAIHRITRTVAAEARLPVQFGAYARLKKFEIACE